MMRILEKRFVMRVIVRWAGDVGERRSCGEWSLLRLLVAGAWRVFLGSATQAQDPF